MKKILRFSLVAMLAAMCNVAFADEIKFDFDNDYATIFPTITGLSSNESHDGDFLETTTSAPVNGATVTVSPKTSGNNANRLWNIQSTGKGRLRLYSGTLTITAPADMDITEMVFDGAKWNAGNTVDAGNISPADDGKNASWVGQAHEVVLSVAGNTQIASITLTVVASGQEAPAEIKISGTNPFIGSTQVTITINKETSDIYYTLDGSDPATNDAAEQYKGAFTITESCNVRAYDEISGASASMEFTKNEAEVVDGIAAFKALEKGEIVNLQLTNAKVLYTWTTNNGNTSTYVRDASGELMFYNSLKDIANNDDLNGTIIVKRDEYNGNIQAGVCDATNMDNMLCQAGEAATPKVITIAEVADNVSNLVTIVGLEFTTDGADNPKYYGKLGEEQIQIYNKFHIAEYEDLAPFVGKTYTISGIIEAYKSSYELCPVEDGISETTGINDINTEETATAVVYNIAGQRVNDNYKGIVIVNGKKSVRK